MGRVVRVVVIVIATVLAAALLLFVLFRLKGLLYTIIISVVTAYLLNKPLKALERHMKRLWALLILFGFLAGAAAAVVFWLAPLLVRQAALLIGNAPRFAESAEEFLKKLGGGAGEPPNNFLYQLLSGVNNRATDWLGTATLSLAQACSAGLGWALLVPVFALYFLKDRESLTAQIFYLVPIRYHEDLHMLFSSIDKSVGHFLRGQILVALIVAVMTGAGLVAVGVPGAPLLGVLCGLFNMIPYVGPFLGAVPVALVSVALGWKRMLVAVAVILVVQQVDNTIISPKILGDSIRINPAYIIAAIIAGSCLFGAMGLIFALPALIVGKEVLSFLFRKRIYR